MLATLKEQKLCLFGQIFRESGNAANHRSLNGVVPVIAQGQLWSLGIDVAGPGPVGL